MILPLTLNGYLSDQQKCSELVFPDGSTGKTDMFLPMKWNFEDYDKKCFKAYHVHPQERFMGKWYGGKSIEAASNIIFRYYTAKTEGSLHL